MGVGLFFSSEKRVAAVKQKGLGFDGITGEGDMATLKCKLRAEKPVHK